MARAGEGHQPNIYPMTSPAATACVSNMLHVVFILATATSVASSALVRTSQGAVSGIELKSFSGRSYFAFKGIPYAAPPVGEHRFKDPVPAKPWPGVWNATNFAGDCLQFGMISLNDKMPPMGDEDCLYLNVYSPKYCERIRSYQELETSSSSINPLIESQWTYYMKLPEMHKSSPLLDVLVYFHGGVFMFGAGNHYGADYLMDRDVVLVTVNYRLGILGFLSTEDEVVPGNAGLKDQSMALRWVHNNIAVFGGNPDSVTLTGTSAGGSSVHFHMLSPMSRGLFHRGMAWSGNAFNRWAMADGVKEKTLKLADLMGCPSRSSKEMVACLRKRPARALLYQMPNFLTWRYNPCGVFGPIVEVKSRSSFLDRHPIEIVLSGDFADVPLLTSVTSEEGLFPAADFIANPDAMEEFSSKFTEIIPYLLMFNYSVHPDLQESVSKNIQQFYFGNKSISRETTQEIIKMVGDRMFNVEVERGARLHAEFGSSPVYFYLFGYRGTNSFSQLFTKSDENFGVSHADDACYTMNPRFINCGISPEDKNVIKLMTDITANFAKTGDPTPSTSKFKWIPVDAHNKSLNFLEIKGSKDYKMSSSVDLGNVAFWDSLPINEPTIALRKNHVGELESLPSSSLSCAVPPTLLCLLLVNPYVHQLVLSLSG